MRSAVVQKWLPHVRIEDFAGSLPLVNWKRLNIRHNEFLASQSKEEWFYLLGLRLIAPAGIYHPRIDSSSDLFLRFLPHFTMKSVLDIGTGTGVLGIYAAKHRNTVTVTDISEAAVRCCIRNAQLNKVTVNAIVSDLFKGLPKDKRFDRILFNYPLYQKNIEHPYELMACDPQALVLRRFLAELNSRLKRGGAAYLMYSTLGNTRLLVNRIRRKRLQAMVIGYDYDEETRVVKYLLEIRRAPKTQAL